MAKKRAAKRVQASGGARMKAKGLNPVQLGLTDAEMELIDEACTRELRPGVELKEPRTKFILRAALEAASEIVAKRKAEAK